MTTATETVSGRGLFSLPAAAEHLGVSVRHVQRMIRNGDLPYVQLGERRILVEPAELDALVARNRRVRGAQPA